MLLVGDLEVGFNFRCCHVTSRLQRVAWGLPNLLAACKTLALQLVGGAHRKGSAHAARVTVQPALSCPTEP